MVPAGQICPRCSSPVASGKNFCSKCGFRLSKPPTRHTANEDDIFQDVASQLFELEARKVEIPIEKDPIASRMGPLGPSPIVEAIKRSLRLVFYSLLTLTVALYGWGIIMRMGAKSKRYHAESLVRKAEQAAVESGSDTTAIPILHSAIYQDPDFPDPYYKLSQLYAPVNINMSIAYQALGNAAKQRDEENAKIHMIITKTVKSLLGGKKTTQDILLPDAGPIPGKSP